MNFPRGTELIILLILLIIVFGWKRLPDAARSLGRSARVFKSEVEEMKKDGKEDANGSTVAGESADQQPRPQQQVAPPPAQNYDPQQFQQPQQSHHPQAQPGQYHQPQKPQAQPQYQQPQYQQPEQPDDPTRPVA